MSCLRSWFVAPFLIASLKLTSSLPNRQLLRLPSAVIRILLHVPQKWSVMLLIKPIRPSQPSTCHSRETALGASSCLTRVKLGYFSRIRSTNSMYGTSLEWSQRLPSKGMYSINRTSRGCFCARAAKPWTSSSLTPRIMTALTFVLIPKSKLFCTDSSTLSIPLLLVRISNLNGSSVSRLTFTESSPASFRSATFLPNVIPFVVIAISRRPLGLNSLVAFTISAKSLRSKGSPPVNLILLTPSSTKREVILCISSASRSLCSGVSCTPSSGMQYVHLKLQRSVREILR
mmetsp:Transcript_14797/g.20734  ORF Transcript_14797/g.20734 Transcript_14797/m.20734 type:complete len:288 (-) Transcript_14797:477-1340(-)